MVLQFFDLQEPLRKILAFISRLVKKCKHLLGNEEECYISRIQNIVSKDNSLPINTDLNEIG